MFSMLKNYKILFIFFGLLSFIYMINSHPPSTISPEAWVVACLLFLMTFWWLTETIPMSITAILPLIIIPVLTEINVSEVAKPYSNPVIFLLLGGFILGLGFQKSNLHLRFAMYILKKIGSKKKYFEWNYHFNIFFKYVAFKYCNVFVNVADRSFDIRKNKI